MKLAALRRAIETCIKKIGDEFIDHKTYFFTEEDFRCRLYALIWQKLNPRFAAARGAGGVIEKEILRVHTEQKYYRDKNKMKSFRQPDIVIFPERVEVLWDYDDLDIKKYRTDTPRGKWFNGCTEEEGPKAAVAIELKVNHWPKVPFSQLRKWAKWSVKTCKLIRKRSRNCTCYVVQFDKYGRFARKDFEEYAKQLKDVEEYAKQLKDEGIRYYYFTAKSYFDKEPVGGERFLQDKWSEKN